MNKQTWIEVAQAGSSMEAEMIAGLLRTADIPVYVESVRGLPSIFGHLADPCRVFVPEPYYEAALDLLDDDNLPALDEPRIQP